MNRYETNLKNTSPVIEDLRNEFTKIPRGVHDLTFASDFDASDGYIIPIDYHELVPNSDLYLKYDVSLISHNPTFRRLLSGASIELRTYKRLKSDSWKGWNNFVTKGRTGKVSKSLPYVDWLLGSNADGSSYPFDRTTLCPHSPACYLGLVPPVFLGVTVSNYSNFVKSSYPQFQCYLHKGESAEVSISDYVTGLTGLTSFASIASSTALRINALPLVMYNSIVKEFLDLDLLINDSDGTYSNWVCENEDNDMILPYEATGAVVDSSYDNWDTPISSSEGTDGISLTARPFLNVLHKANKRGDYFDTGSPFPDLLRGDVPTIEVLGGQITDSTLDFSDAVAPNSNSGSSYLLGLTNGKLSSLGVSGAMSDSYAVKVLKNSGISASHVEINSTDPKIINHDTLINALNQGKLSNASFSSIQFSMNQWRALATLTVFAERMARTDGSYNSLIMAQFGHNPSWHGHRPVFCGGSRQPLVFSEVVQQSTQVNSEGTPVGTPLGTTAGRSVSAQDNNMIKIHTDDYCDVMTVMVIRPDEYYCQGVDKRVSRLENIEQYFPIMNNLAPDATLNKELYVSGTNATDENVFNYQERFAYYKSLRNRVSGLLALPASVVGSIGQYVKHRIFSNTPNFNIAFTQESEDTNMKQVYTSSVESEYIIHVGTQAKLVAPIPEKTIPSDMGISY